MSTQKLMNVRYLVDGATEPVPITYGPGAEFLGVPRVGDGMTIGPTKYTVTGVDWDIGQSVTVKLARLCP